MSASADILKTGSGYGMEPRIAWLPTMTNSYSFVTSPLARMMCSRSSRFIGPPCISQCNAPLEIPTCASTCWRTCSGSTDVRGEAWRSSWALRVRARMVRQRPFCKTSCHCLHRLAECESPGSTTSPTCPVPAAAMPGQIAQGARLLHAMRGFADPALHGAHPAHAPEPVRRAWHGANGLRQFLRARAAGRRPPAMPILPYAQFRHDSQVRAHGWPGSPDSTAASVLRDMPTREAISTVPSPCSLRRRLSQSPNCKSSWR